MNIVVMLGTNPYSFDRLVRPLDELAGKKQWEVFVQLGHTSYRPRHCKFELFVSRSELIDRIRAADLVICHGGFGSIRDALSFGKPVLAVPRQPEFQESQDCQEEMVREMEEQGYLIGVYDISELSAAVDKAYGFMPTSARKSKIPGLIQAFIEQQGEQGRRS